MSARYGHEFVEAVALIAAKAASTRKVASPEEAARFALWSVGEVGDASIDEADFQRHWRNWRRLLSEEFDSHPWEATRSNDRLKGEEVLTPRPLV